MPGGRNTAGVYFSINKLKIFRDPLSLEGLVFNRALTIKAFITAARLDLERTKNGSILHF
jgi:hypothetical protein